MVQCLQVYSLVELGSAIVQITLTFSSMLTHTHSPGIEPESSNVRDMRDPASTLISLTYEKEDSQSSHEMISQLRTMFFPVSSEGYLD